ncbi:MAG: hypothetical protein AAFN77_21355 [Planctomycetota bacterium]
MRKLTVFANVCALMLGLACVQDVNAQWPQTTNRDIRFSVELGSMAFDRPGIDSTAPVLSDSFTGRTLFNSEQATDLGTSFGAQVKLNFVNRRDREIEIRTSIVNWEEQADFTGANLASPFFPTGLTTTPDEFEYNYESSYFSIEANRRRAVMPGVTIFAGPRFVSITDEIETISTSTVGAIDLTQTDVFEATNALIGLQAGFEFNFPVTHAINVQSFIRAGGYFNPTEFNTNSQNTFTTVTTSLSTDESIESFLGEVGGRVSFDILPNCVTSYVGYEAIWIDGINLAPANATSTTAGLDTSNTVFFHAVNFGVQVLY